MSMKITINIDCTPQEARSFFGLPDVEPMNAMIMEEMQRKAQDNLETLADPERFVAQMMQGSAKGMEAFQAMMAAAASGKK